LAQPALFDQLVVEALPDAERTHLDPLLSQGAVAFGLEIAQESAVDG